jgi:hypothetical protein
MSYDDFIREDERGQPRSSIAKQMFDDMRAEQQVFDGIRKTVNSEISPSKWGEAWDIADRYGTSIDAVYDDLEEWKKLGPTEETRRFSPVYDSLLRDPRYGPIAQEQIDRMPYMERVFRAFTDSISDTVEQIDYSDIGYRVGMNGGNYSAEDTARIEEIRRGNGIRDYNIGLFSEIPRHMANAGTYQAITTLRSWDEIAMGTVAGGVAGSVVPGWGTAAGAIAGAKTAGVAGQAIENFKVLYGDIYNEARFTKDADGKYLDHETAHGIALLGGGVSTAVELGALAVIVRNMPAARGLVGKYGASKMITAATKSPAARTAIRRIVGLIEVGVAESAEEIAQELTKLGLIIREGGVTQDGVPIRDTMWERTREAGWGGFWGGIGIGGITTGVDVAIQAGSQRVFPNQNVTEDQILDEIGTRSEARRQSVNELGKAAREMPHESVKGELGKRISLEGVPPMYAPAENIVQLFQEEGILPDEQNRKYPEIVRGIEEAQETGAEVKLSPEGVILLAQLQKFDQIVGEDLRTGDHEVTVREVTEAKEQHAQAQEQAALQEGAGQVEQEIVKQLADAGIDPRSAEDMIRGYFMPAVANIVSRINQAQGPYQTGMSVERFLKRYGFKVSYGEQAPAGAMEQTSIERLGSVAAEQRGDPEIQMTRVQSALGGGVLSPVVERAGDLLHRPWNKLEFQYYAQDDAKTKIDTVMRRLTHPYGFEREHEQNMRNNAKARGETLEEYRAKLDAEMKKYADLYRSMRVYNSFQRLVRDMNVAIGEQRWDDARDLAAQVNDIIYSPAEEYDARVLEDEDTTLYQSGVPLFDAPLQVTGTGAHGRVTIKDVAQAFTDDFMVREGRKLYPEKNEADYQAVLEDLKEEVALQLQEENSGVGWYSKDVSLAIEMASLIFPTLKTNPDHRRVLLTLAGVFSSGNDPDRAFMIASEAFEGFLTDEKISVTRAEAREKAGMEPLASSVEGEQAGWTQRNAANEQHLAFINYIIEREGGLTKGLDWLMSLQSRAAINDARIKSGLYKTGVYKTVAEKAGPNAYGILAIGPKLGRYILGLNGFAVDATDTTIDLWYVRTYRRLTGRLFDPPKGIEGIVGQPTPADREVVFRLTQDLQKAFKGQGLTPGDIQAVLWFYEKRLWEAHGIKVKKGTNSSGARQLLESKGRFVGSEVTNVASYEREGRDVESSGFVLQEQTGLEPRSVSARKFTAFRLGRKGDGKARLYKRKGNQRDRKVRGIVNYYTPNKEVVDGLTEAGYPALDEIEELAPERAEDFHKSISDSKAASDYGAAVYVYDLEEYRGMRLFMTPDKKAGFAIKSDGDIVSVFSDGGGKTAAMLSLATEHGGTKLDAYDTILPEIYEINGFKEVRRDTWDDQYAPDDWSKETFADYNNGEPDIVYMEYDQKFDAYSREIARLYQRVDQTQTPEFQNWATWNHVTQERGDGTKVVDESGRPLVVYHTTDQDFSVFNTTRTGGRAGVYFATSPTDSTIEYIHSLQRQGENVMPVYLSIQNPHRMFPRDAYQLDERLVEALKKRGHDGIVSVDEKGEVREWIAFEDTQIKSAIGNTGAYSLTDPDIMAQDARGFLSLDPARQNLEITLTGKADLSTFMHESAHFFLEVLQDVVERGEAPQSMVDDLQILRDWTGAKKGKFQRKHHEKFARGFEAYLMEGKAPDSALQSAFNKFRAWLVFIYKSIRGLNVELTDDVRGVMDRLIASDEAIAEARIEIGIPDTPPTQEDLLLTDDEYVEFLEMWTKSNEAQRQEMDARLMLEYRKEQRAAWRQQQRGIEDGLRKKLAKTKGYKAWQRLIENNIKIAEDSVPEELRGLAGDLMTQGAEGQLLEVVAAGLGYTSSERMLKAINEARAKDRRIPREARDQMIARHGHLTDDRLATEALKAVHTDETQNVLFTEFRALAESVGLKVISGLHGMLKEAARREVMDIAPREMQPYRFRRAELKKAQESAAASAAGDKLTAALAKRQQMAAAAKYRAYTEAKDNAEKIRKKLRPFQTNKLRSRIGKASQINLDAIDSILERVDFRKKSAKLRDKVAAFEKVQAEMEAAGTPLDVPADFVSMIDRTNYQDMTYGELVAMADAVMQIWHQAKLKEKLKDGRERRLLRDFVSSVATVIARTFPKGVKKLDERRQWVRRAFRTYQAALTKEEQVFQWIDGQRSGGPTHRMIFQPFVKAGRAEFLKWKRFSTDLFMPFAEATRSEIGRKLSTTYTFMGEERTGEEIFMSVLYWGTAQRREKLLRGMGEIDPTTGRPFGWDPEQYQREMFAFMNTKEMWDLAQLVWDQVSTLWPEIEAMTKRVKGIAPPKVEDMEIHTPFGTYTGKYIPIIYDPDAQGAPERIKDIADATDKVFSQFERVSFNDSFTKETTNFIGPLKLSFDNIAKHLKEVIHYTTHYEAVMQAERIRRDPGFKKLIIDHLGIQAYREMETWIKDIANDQATMPLSRQGVGGRILRYLRSGTTVMAMGWRTVTALKQWLGFTTTAAEIGSHYTAVGVQKAWTSRNRVSNWKFAFEESNELEQLFRSFDRDVKRMTDDHWQNLRRGAKVKQGYEWLVYHAFDAIGGTQTTVNVATWWGAYEKAMAEHQSHEDGVAYADAVVRMTQGSGAVKDLAGVQRGSEANRMFTMFYSWFSVAHQITSSIARDLTGRSEDRRVLQNLKRIAIVYFVTAAMEELVDRSWKRLTEGEDEDDEEFGYLMSVLVGALEIPVTGLPFLRELPFASPETAARKLTDKRVYPSEISPLVRVAVEADRTYNALADWALEGEPPTESERRAIIKLISIGGRTPLAAPHDLLEDLIGED